MRKIPKALCAGLMATAAACQVSHPTFYQWGKGQTMDTNTIAANSDTADQTPQPVRGGQPIGEPDPDTALDLAVHVGFRNEAELDRFLDDAANPKSPRFGQFLSHEEFAARFLPTPQQLDAVRQALAERGLRVDTDATGAVITAHASVADAEHAFNVRLQHYEDPSNHRTVRAPSGPISLPAGLGIIAVHGLATPPNRAPHHVVAKAEHTARAGALVPYRVSTIRKAYNIPDSMLGEGAVIGMLELDGYKPRDIQQYAAQNGIGMPTLTNVLLGGYNGQVLSGGGQMEVTLDIQMAMAMAPRAKEIVVYSANQTNNATAWFSIWNEMANPRRHPLVRTISVSWGTPEDYAARATLQSENAILKQMAAQGQSVFVASGDNGAYDDGSHLVTDDPASQFWAIGVGGTRLSVSQDGSRLSESAWLNGGGGISSYWKAPSWQLTSRGQNVSSNLRNVPDVSLNADPATAYAVYTNGYWSGVGGTSAATPLWAAFWECAQQARIAAGKPTLGFASPILWAADPSGYYDIADNTTNGHYRAAPGYDHSTGLGTLNGAAMLGILLAK